MPLFRTTDHLKRLTQFMDAEARYLAARAHRARVLDHKGNRGGEVECEVRNWVRDRVEPEFTVTSGEIVDAFGTNADEDSRQHDLIVHANTRDARQFSLGGGIRLVPIEAVAVVIDVKLTLNATEFARADAAASMTSRLRLAVHEVRQMAGAGGPVVERAEAMRDGGLRLRTRQLAMPIGGAPQDDLGGRVAFGIFGFDGPENVETIGTWLRDAKALSFVCCLSTGCVTRFHDGSSHPEGGGVCRVSDAERALTHFAAILRGFLGSYETSASTYRANYSLYQEFQALAWWDRTGYQPPRTYRPTDEERDELIRRGHLPVGWTYALPKN